MAELGSIDIVVVLVAIVLPVAALGTFFFLAERHDRRVRPRATVITDVPPRPSTLPPGGDMRDVELVVRGRDGNTARVARIVMPSFDPLPAVVVWGTRFFTLEAVGAPEPRYVEAFGYIAPPAFVRIGLPGGELEGKEKSDG